jgi:hypothetical protein
MGGKPTYWGRAGNSRIRPETRHSAYMVSPHLRPKRELAPPRARDSVETFFAHNDRHKLILISTFAIHRLDNSSKVRSGPQNAVRKVAAILFGSPTWKRHSASLAWSATLACKAGRNS